MKFYTRQHHYYCGIDLHARSMYVCILDSKSHVKFHKNIKTSPGDLMKALHNLSNSPHIPSLDIAQDFFPLPL